MCGERGQEWFGDGVLSAVYSEDKGLDFCLFGMRELEQELGASHEGALGVEPGFVL